MLILLRPDRTQNPYFDYENSISNIYESGHEGAAVLLSDFAVI